MSTGKGLKYLAVTLGDPGGIGMEIALKAAYGRGPAQLTLVLVGNPRLLSAQARRLRLPLPPAIGHPLDLRRAARRPMVYLWDPDNAQPGRSDRLAWRPGKTGRDYGRLSAAWVKAAVAGCQQGWFDGIVTAPICKKSLALAGLPFPGHTEYLAALTGVKDFAMMLIGGPLRVVLATRHLPLARVPKALTIAGIVATAKLTAAALRWLTAGQPGRAALAICALNPHAGDGGLLGREEAEIIAPAVRRLRRAGLNVVGPVPADVVFHQAARGDYGAVLAMYHDQGLGPLKTLAFDTGVNLTLGLPIIRTSPDHGTAFDIAGRGVADARSMQAAIALANDLARRPNPWRGK